MGGATVSVHGNNGMTFAVPGPVKYFMIATFGATEIWEIKLVSCDGQVESQIPVQIMAGKLTEGMNTNRIPGSWDFAKKGKSAAVCGRKYGRTIH